MSDKADSIIDELNSTFDATDMDQLSHADLIFAVKTLNSLSKEMDIPKFCNNLLHIAVKQTGAVKGLFFLMDNADHPILKSAVTAVKTTKKTAFAKSIVNWVAQKQKMILVRDVLSSSFYSCDHHLMQQQIKSILCIPMVQNEKTEAIAYIEDFKVEKASTKNNLFLLRLIISQASLLLCRLIGYQARIEDGKRYRELYQQESAKAQLLAGKVPSRKTIHNIRASINAILGYSQILKESLPNTHMSDGNNVVQDHLDQIILRVWDLLNSFDRIVTSVGSKNGPENCSKKNRRLDENNLLLTDGSVKHTQNGNNFKSSEIIKVKLDYDIKFHPYLLAALKKAEQKCLSIKKTMIIREVDAFGTDVACIGNRFQSSAITRWGETLKEHSTNFNKKEMELMMQWFPEIVLNVANRQPGKADIKMIWRR
jgi:putative methionine-R-sulfoxide reductase with GAF domain